MHSARPPTDFCKHLKKRMDRPALIGQLDTETVCPPRQSGAGIPLICGAGDVDLWRWRLLIQNEERCMSGITSFYNRMLLYPLLGEYMFGKGTSTHKSVFRPTADCLPENRQRDYMSIAPRGPVEHKNKIRIRIDSEHVSCRLPKSILLIRGALRNSSWRMPHEIHDEVAPRRQYRYHRRETYLKRPRPSAGNKCGDGTGW